MLPAFHWAQLWRASRSFMAPLLVIIMATLGCGRMPHGTLPAAGGQVARRVQAVSTYDVGVGYRTTTGEFFAFSDFEATKQSSESIGAFLVALEGYEVVGATSSISGRIDARVRSPGGWELPVSAGVDRFYYQDGAYDWAADLASANREITPEQFDAVAAIAASVVATSSVAPREVVSEATANGTRTAGSAWADVRLMLAAIGVWAAVQPESTWFGGGGNGGSTTSSGSVETIWPQQFHGVSIDLGDRSVAPVYQMPTLPVEATGSLIVRIESADFASGSLCANIA
ncbi:MAG: hypothetical protein FJZ01_17390 [Candidatus Sericytochromatia bacterium]|nr:hypothetical protein [Candidatus Tanganyikabacteria bacterium]